MNKQSDSSRSRWEDFETPLLMLSIERNKEKQAGFSDPLGSSAAVGPAPAATKGSLFATSSDLQPNTLSEEEQRLATSLMDPLQMSLCLEIYAWKERKSERRLKKGPHPNKLTCWITTENERKMSCGNVQKWFDWAEMFCSQKDRSLRSSVNSAWFRFDNSHFRGQLWANIYKWEMNGKWMERECMGTFVVITNNIDEEFVVG